MGIVSLATRVLGEPARGPVRQPGGAAHEGDYRLALLLLRLDQHHIVALLVGPRLAPALGLSRRGLPAPGLQLPLVELDHRVRAVLGLLDPDSAEHLLPRNLLGDPQP